MNTLTLIKKQIEKAAALHDAQIAMTSCRGVKVECQQGQESETHVLSAIVVTLTPSDVMEALQITGLIAFGCVAGMSLLLR